MNRNNIKKILWAVGTVTLFSYASVVSSADVSSKISDKRVPLIAGCMFRLDLYAGQSKNFYPNDDPRHQAKVAQGYLKIAQPYSKELATVLIPKLPGGMVAFAQMQEEVVKQNIQTNNVWFDAMDCTRELMTEGVMYPKGSKMAPEQLKVMQELLGR